MIAESITEGLEFITSKYRPIRFIFNEMVLKEREHFLLKSIWILNLGAIYIKAI